MHHGEVWSSGRGQRLVTPGAAGTLSPLPEAGGGMCPAPMLVQPQPKRPMAHVARAGKAPQQGQEPQWGPAPTMGLGDGSGGGHSPTAPFLLLPGRRSPSPHAHTLGRAWPSLPGWVTAVSPCGHWEWATGMLAGQCPATALGSFALGRSWPPPALTDLSGRAMPGCAVTTSKLGEELRKALARWHPPAASAEGTTGLAQTSPGDSKRGPPPRDSSSCLSLGGVTSGWAPSPCPHGILGCSPSPRTCHPGVGSITWSVSL